nr:ATP-binding protein [Streptomyces palmae]
MAGLARLFLANLLLSAGVAEKPVEAAKLCVTELVANAHKHTATTVITVEALLAAGRLTVHVHDDMPEGVVVPQANESDIPEHGRGLRLVSRYADLWGTTIYGRAAPERKSVWFLLDSVANGRADDEY